jgi:hypothetical protein
VESFDTSISVRLTSVDAYSGDALARAEPSRADGGDPNSVHDNGKNGHFAKYSIVAPCSGGIAQADARTRTPLPLVSRGRTR